MSDDGTEVVVRTRTERGEVVVRRRAGDVLELRVNGVFVMDTAETGTERLLARATLAQVARPRRVLVGGLGLGFTVGELLADERVEQVVVAEIEPAVVGWMRAGVLPGGDLLSDPRVRLQIGDVRAVVSRAPARGYEVVLLDVDNGPDFLVYDANAEVYGERFLSECRRVLDDHGALTVWSSTRSGELADALRRVFGAVEVTPLAVDLQGRDEQYWLYTSKMLE